MLYSYNYLFLLHITLVIIITTVIAIKSNKYIILIKNFRMCYLFILLITCLLLLFLNKFKIDCNHTIILYELYLQIHKNIYYTYIYNLLDS